MRKWTVFLAGALAVTLALSIAGVRTGAASDDKDKSAAFQRLDKDGDGTLSASEFAAKGKGDPDKTKKVESRFKRLDADGDGKLTPAEFESGGGKKGGKKKSGGADEDE